MENTDKNIDNVSGKKVFIIGSSAAEFTLAKKLSESDEIAQVFVAPGMDAMKDFCTIVDIREQNVQELLEFALENAIDMTIAASETAIKNDIATLFQQNNQMIFAPTKDSASICLYKSVGKKFMYKNRIPCSKFGIFDKASLAIDYAKNASMPIVVKTDENQEKGVLVCNAFSVAKDFIEDLFEKGEKKVIIEDYAYGHEFSFYVITDGYHALPLGSVATYKSELEGNGGLMTPGVGAFTPDYKVSQQVERKIFQNIIYPTLSSLAHSHTPYVGILGVDLIMDENEQLYALKFNSFLQVPDAQVILALLNENIYSLLEACVVGSFADDYNYIDIEDKSAVSCVLSSLGEDKIISELDEVDDETQLAFFNIRKNQYLEYETKKGRTIILTRTARVLSKAVSDLYEEIEVVKFDGGMKFRNDIGK